MNRILAVALQLISPTNPTIGQNTKNKKVHIGNIGLENGSKTFWEVLIFRPNYNLTLTSVLRKRLGDELTKLSGNECKDKLATVEKRKAKYFGY